MKKFIVLLLTLILVACGNSRDKYYLLTFDNYTLAVGNDTADFLNVIFDFDVKQTFVGNETVNDIDLYLDGVKFGKASLTNPKQKETTSKETIVSSIEFYVEDYDIKDLRINNIALDTSIKSNCEKFNGEYLYKNGNVCIIEETVDDSNNSIILYGDISELNQDKLDKIKISIN